MCAAPSVSVPGPTTRVVSVRSGMRSCVAVAVPAVDRVGCSRGRKAWRAQVVARVRPVDRATVGSVLVRIDGRRQRAPVQAGPSHRHASRRRSGLGVGRQFHASRRRLREVQRPLLLPAPVRRVQFIQRGYGASHVGGSHRRPNVHRCNPTALGVHDERVHPGGRGRDASALEELQHLLFDASEASSRSCSTALAGAPPAPWPPPACRRRLRRPRRLRQARPAASGRCEPDLARAAASSVQRPRVPPAPSRTRFRAPRGWEV